MTAFDVSERGAGSSLYRVVLIHGELSLPDVDELQAILDAAAEFDAGVVIGLEDCEFIDSMALAALLRAHNRFAQEGRRLVIGGAGIQVRRVLEISGLNIEGLVFGSVDDALSDE